MTKKRLQSKIAGSKYSLPITAVLFATAWVGSGLTAPEQLVSLGLIMATTFVMARLNTVHAIMRTYSRMPSCSFLAICAICLPCFLLPSTAMLPLCFCVACFLLFQTYQDKTATGIIFVVFAIIGASSLLFIQMLFLVPIMWIVMGTRMMAMSARTFWASILGLITPYWFAAVWFFYSSDIIQLVNHITSIADFSPLGVYSWDVFSLMFVLILLLCIIGTIHFVKTSHNDKIRTRMIYESFIFFNIAITAIIILQPVHMPKLLPIMAVSASPMLAHYATYTHSKFSNITFLLIVLLAIFSAAYHLWIF